MVTESEDFWDKLVVGGDFGHFLASAQVYGEGGGVFGEDDW